MKAGDAVEDIRSGGVDGSRGDRPRQLGHGDIEAPLRPVLRIRHGRQLEQAGWHGQALNAEAHAVLRSWARAG
jgi:hypothetical protein